MQRQPEPARTRALTGRLALLLPVLLAFAAPAAARPDASLTLDVTFSANQTIAVTLPDGTPVGTTSGAPTSIPAGYYTISYTGSGR